jgi:hypothetical protein
MATSGSAAKPRLARSGVQHAVQVVDAAEWDSVRQAAHAAQAESAQADIGAIAFKGSGVLLDKLRMTSPEVKAWA